MPELTDEQTAEGFKKLTDMVAGFRSEVGRYPEMDSGNPLESVLAVVYGVQLAVLTGEEESQESSSGSSTSSNSTLRDDDA